MALWRYRLLCVLFSTLLLGTEAGAKALRGVRFGHHGTSSRVVFDLPQGTAYRLEAGPDPETLRVIFPELSLPPKLSRLQAKDPLIQEIRLSTDAAAVIADIILKQPGIVQQHSLVKAPPRVVLDIARQGASVSPPTPTGNVTGKPQTVQETGHKQPLTSSATSPGLGTVQSGLPAPAPAAAPTRPAPATPTSANTAPAVPLSSLTPSQLLERAEKHWAERHIDAAQRAYTTFLQRFPEHPNNHLIAARIADILRAQQHPRAALEAYTAVLQGYPGSEGALISQIRLAELGMAFPDILPPGDEPRYTAYRQPLQTMQRLISEFPFSPFADVARFKIGEILLRQGELTAALESFEALNERPLPEPLRRDVAHSLRQSLIQIMAAQQQRGAFLEVLRTFFTHKQHLQAAEVVQSELLLPVALSYAQLGLLDEAQSLFASLLPGLTDPAQRAELAFDQAMRLAKHGQLQAAASLLTPPTQFAEPARQVQALQLLTESAWQARRLDDTVRYGQQAVAALTDPAARLKLWTLLSDAYEARGETSLAVQALRQCAAAGHQGQNTALSTPAEACLVRAVALQAQDGQAPQKLALYEQLLQTLPHSTSKEASLFHIADLYRQQGDTAQMLATFSRLREQSSDALWQHVAAEYLEQAQWQERLQERLAAFQNSLMR